MYNPSASPSNPAGNAISGDVSAPPRRLEVGTSALAAFTPLEAASSAALDDATNTVALIVGGLALGAISIWAFVERRRRRREIALLNDAIEQRVRERTAELEDRQHSLAAQLRQAQKRESLGRLTGGVAHDFNNLLTVIFGYAEILTHKLESERIDAPELLEIRRAAERAAELTRQLLMFGREQAARPKTIEIDLLVQSVERLLQRVIGEQIELVVAAGAPGAMLFVDPHQLEQVLLNLTINARDAMPNGGKLTLTTRLEAAVERADHRGAAVSVLVKDTGQGIDPEDLEHIFEPFFTTKAEGSGTGLGLATVAEIVEQLGGTIAVESELGIGSTFRVTIPLHTGALTPRPPLPGAVDDRGRETLLVVEDESRLRSMFAGELRRRGYTVLEAADGQDALRTALDHRGSIDALVTDLVMPNMGGAELAQHLVVDNPRLRVLFASGYAYDANALANLGDIEKVFLEKPFVPAELSRCLRQLLDRLPQR